MMAGTPLPEDMLQWEQRRCEALLAADVPALESLLSESLVYVHSTAVGDTRASYLRKLREGVLRYQSLALFDLRVQCGPQAAVVTGRMEAVVVKDGQPRPVRSLFMTVWWPEQGHWRLQAHQGTVLPPDCLPMRCAEADRPVPMDCTPVYCTPERNNTCQSLACPR